MSSMYSKSTNVRGVLYMRGRDVSVDRKAGFTGVLLKRQYRAGQRYMQLLFKTAEGQRLALSRDLQLVRSLQPGQYYQVEGDVRTAPGRSYLLQPTIMPVEAPSASAAVRTPRQRRTRLALAGLVAIALITGVFSIVRAPHAPGDAVAAKASPVTTNSPATAADGAVSGTTTLTEDQSVPSSSDSPATSSAGAVARTPAGGAPSQGTTVPVTPPTGSSVPTQTDPVPTQQQPLPVDTTPTPAPLDATATDTTPPADTGTATTPPSSTDTTTPTSQQ